MLSPLFFRLLAPSPFTFLASFICSTFIFLLSIFPFHASSSSMLSSLLDRPHVGHSRRYPAGEWPNVRRPAAVSAAAPSAPFASASWASAFFPAGSSNFVLQLLLLFCDNKEANMREPSRERRGRPTANGQSLFGCCCSGARPIGHILVFLFLLPTNPCRINSIISILVINNKKKLINLYKSEQYRNTILFCFYNFMLNQCRIFDELELL